MTPERWPQVKEIFHLALQHEPAQMQGFLTKACGDDVELRREVQWLISSHERDGSFIDSPAFQLAAEMIVNEQGELRPGQGGG